MDDAAQRRLTGRQRHDPQKTSCGIALGKGAGRLDTHPMHPNATDSVENIVAIGERIRAVASVER